MGILSNCGLDLENIRRQETQDFINHIDLLTKVNEGYKQIKTIFSDYFNSSICQENKEDILESIKEIQSWPTSVSITEFKDIMTKIMNSNVFERALRLKIDGKELNTITNLSKLFNDTIVISVDMEYTKSINKSELTINYEEKIEKEIERLNKLREKIASNI